MNKFNIDTYNDSNEMHDMFLQFMEFHKQKEKDEKNKKYKLKVDTKINLYNKSEKHKDAIKRYREKQKLKNYELRIIELFKRIEPERQRILIGSLQTIAISKSLRN